MPLLIWSLPAYFPRAILLIAPLGSWVHGHLGVITASDSTSNGITPPASICAITLGTNPSPCINVPVLQVRELRLRGQIHLGRSLKPGYSSQSGCGTPTGSLIESLSV